MDIHLLCRVEIIVKLVVVVLKEKNIILDLGLRTIACRAHYIMSARSYYDGETERSSVYSLPSYYILGTVGEDSRKQYFETEPKVEKFFCYGLGANAIWIHVRNKLKRFAGCLLLRGPSRLKQQLRWRHAGDDDDSDEFTKLLIVIVVCISLPRRYDIIVMIIIRHECNVFAPKAPPVWSRKIKIVNLFVGRP